MIFVLLSAYNGATYLPALLDSLLTQTVQDLFLCVLDDASTDETPQILAAYEQRFSGRMQLLRSKQNTGNAMEGFFYLLKNCTAQQGDYFFFCDQDDVWLPDKVEETLQCIKKLETVRGEKMPLLVHTDLEVVNRELEPLSPSFLTSMSLSGRDTTLNQLLLQNVVTGCTAAFNFPLFVLLQEPPAFALMHDHWAALVAAALGEVGFLDHATVQYRQHGGNQIGAKNAKNFSYLWHKFFSLQENIRALENAIKQGESLLMLYETRLSPYQRELVTQFAGLCSMGRLSRVKILFQYKIWKKGLHRKIYQVFACLWM